MNVLWPLLIGGSLGYWFFRYCVGMCHIALFYWLRARLLSMRERRERSSLDPDEVATINLILFKIGEIDLVVHSGKEILESGLTKPMPSIPWDPASLVAILSAHQLAKEYDSNYWWRWPMPKTE